MNYTVEEIIHPKTKRPFWTVTPAEVLSGKDWTHLKFDIIAIGGHYNISPNVRKLGFYKKPDEAKIKEIFENYPIEKTNIGSNTESKVEPKISPNIEPKQDISKIETNIEPNKETEEIKKNEKSEEYEKPERDIPISQKINNLYKLTRYEYLSEALKDLPLSADVRVIYDDEQIVRATVRDILDKDVDINRINKIRKFINKDNILFSTAQHVSAIVRAIDAGLYVEYNILREYPKVLDRYKDKKAFTNNIPAELQFSFLIKDAQVFKTYDDFLNRTNTWATSMGLKSAVGDSKNSFQMWFYYKLKYSAEVEDKYLKDEIYPVLEKYKKTKLDFWRECQRIKSKSKINARLKLNTFFNQ